MHEEGARSPSTTTNEDNNNHACDMGLLDRWMTNDEVANCLEISHASAYKIIRNRIGPKQLTYNILKHHLNMHLS
jgi:hypothetical protein